MKEPTAADRHAALIRSERHAFGDWQDAVRAWGSSDPSTIRRREKLDDIRARLNAEVTP
jgi:hypothetical protein